MGRWGREPSRDSLGFRSVQLDELWCNSVTIQEEVGLMVAGGSVALLDRLRLRYGCLHLQFGAVSDRGTNVRVFCL